MATYLFVFFMYKPSFFSRPNTRQNQQQQRLNHHFLRFVDDIELCLPAVPVTYTYTSPSLEFTAGYDPVFNDYSQKTWELLSATTLQTCFDANQSIRQEVSSVRSSGSSGIGYVLAHPPTQQTIKDASVDSALKIWQQYLPANISVMSLMSEHLEIASFDAEVYQAIDDLRKTMPRHLSENQIAIRLKEDSSITTLIEQLQRMAYTIWQVDLLFEKKYENSVRQLLLCYIDHYASYNFNYALVGSTSDDNQQGLLKSSLDTRINQQSELFENLSAQLRLQSPLRVIDGKQIRLNGPELLKDFIKSYKLNPYQATSDSHIVIDLQKIQPAQQFFDLTVAAFIQKSHTPMSEPLQDYLDAKVQGKLEVPLCPAQTSPLYPILSNLNCIKDEAGLDKIFEFGGEQFRKLQPEPDYLERIRQDLDKYTKGHYFADLSTQQSQHLKEMGIQPNPTLFAALYSTCNKRKNSDANFAKQKLSSR